jgi:alginate O-acetyltransferase complex protein AlgI
MHQAISSGKRLMIFQSPIFLFVFLPLVLLGYHALSGSLRRRNGLLIIASLTFYSYWDVRLLPLLVVSIVASWSIATLAIRRNSRILAILGIATNLLLLGWFKYANFFASTISKLTGQPFDGWDILLPLAISFFTFHQISYLVDIWRGNRTEYRLDDYFLYIAFFPHLIAGPIVRHYELLPQIERRSLPSNLHEMIGRGGTLFCLGLAKKLWIADPLGMAVDPIFAQAESNALPWQLSAIATVGFSLQIYFDFSSYTDMALGLALMFGFELPKNFDQPYRSTSLIEFWRRWHITLSRFLRDYLYIPLGGNRQGKARQYLALASTMTLGGLWHGAAWTFIIWGLVHGVALIVNHAWRRIDYHIHPAVAWLLTFTVVSVCFVFFRSPSLGTALHILLPAGGTFEWGLKSQLKDVLVVIFSLTIALSAPTNQQVAEKINPTIFAAVVTGLLAAAIVITVLGAADYTPFLYFEF